MFSVCMGCGMPDSPIVGLFSVFEVVENLAKDPRNLLGEVGDAFDIVVRALLGIRSVPGRLGVEIISGPAS